MPKKTRIKTDDPMRGTGRTTGLMLIAIGDALLHPGQWRRFQDHRPITAATAVLYSCPLGRLCAKLGLKMRVRRGAMRRNGNVVEIMSLVQSRKET